VEPRDIGAASGTLTFFRSVGGTFGVSLFSAIFTNRLHDDLATRLSSDQLAELTRYGGRLDAAALKALPEAVQSHYVQAVAHATQNVFGWAVLFGALALLAGFLVRTGRAGKSA